MFALLTGVAMILRVTHHMLTELPLGRKSFATACKLTDMHFQLGNHNRRQSSIQSHEQCECEWWVRIWSWSERCSWAPYTCRFSSPRCSGQLRWSWGPRHCSCSVWSGNSSNSVSSLANESWSWWCENRWCCEENWELPGGEGRRDWRPRRGGRWLPSWRSWAAWRER